MDLTVAASGREITIDRRLKARVRRDAVLEAIVAPRGSRRLALAGVVPGVAGLALWGWGPAAALLVVGVVGQVAWWWIRVHLSLREGLDIGQTVRVDYAASGEISITDSTEQVWLRRASAQGVLRYRGNVTVVGPELVFMLPQELLTDEDVAYLLGRDPAARAGTVQGPQLPLACEITPEIQRGVVSAATRQVVRGADFLMPWVASIFIVGVMSISRSVPVIIGTSLVCALLVVPGLFGIRRTRQRMRQTYAVGLVVRALVSSERFWLSTAVGTAVLEWSAFSKLRVTREAVLLRMDRRFLQADRTIVVPAAVFDDEALATISKAVRGRL